MPEDVKPLSDEDVAWCREEARKGRTAFGHARTAALLATLDAERARREAAELALEIERREREGWMEALVSVVGEHEAQRRFSNALYLRAHPEPVAGGEEG